jgi:MFS transporter, DHA1 family, inner membrane transport protein
VGGRSGRGESDEELLPEVSVRIRPVKPDGLPAALILAVLGTAGFNCLLIMSAIVSGLVDGLHIPAAVAGRIGSCDSYGLSVGAFVAVLIVRRISWRPAAYALLCTLISLDLATTLLNNVGPLMLMRAVHGLCGGVLIGVSYGVFARSGMPDRCFGMLCAVQGVITGFGLMFLPRLVPLYGTSALFVALAACSAVALLLVPLLPEFAISRQPALARASTASWAADFKAPLVLALLAIFFFQAGNMALAAYIIELGRGNALSLQFITNSIGIAGWVGTLGALLVVAIGTRWGRTLPIAIGTIAAILGNAAFYAGASPVVYAAANIATAMTWYFGISYLLGLSAAFDPTGRSAVLAGLASKLGYASGPLAASFLIGTGTGTGAVATYGSVIALAVGSLCASATLGIVASRKYHGTPAGASAED